MMTIANPSAASRRTDEFTRKGMSMRKFAVPGAAALACMLLMAVSARAAGLPTFKSDLIVPNHSVAGVRLHAGYGAAVSAFRSGGRQCSLKQGCSYQLANGSTFSLTFVRLTTHGSPFVGQITISAGRTVSGSRSSPDFDTPLATLKTASGIGLGSTAAAVKRAYPHIRKDSSVDFTIPGPGEYGTTFTLADGRVAYIEMQAVHLG